MVPVALAFRAKPFAFVGEEATDVVPAKEFVPDAICAENATPLDTADPMPPPLTTKSPVSEILPLIAPEPKLAFKVVFVFASNTPTPVGLKLEPTAVGRKMDPRP